MKPTTLLLGTLATLAAVLPLTAANAYERPAHVKRSPSATSTTYAVPHKPRATVNEPSWSGNSNANSWSQRDRGHDGNDSYRPRRMQADDDHRGYRHFRNDDRRGFRNHDGDFRPWQHRRHKRWWWRAWR